MTTQTPKQLLVRHSELIGYILLYLALGPCVVWPVLAPLHGWRDNLSKSFQMTMFVNCKEHEQMELKAGNGG